jgi:ribosomal protein S18 acetylase RimI-like enzyme
MIKRVLLIHFLLIGAVAGYVKNNLYKHSTRDTSLSTWLTSQTNVPKPIASKILVKFTMREATNSDTYIVSGFLDQLRTFHAGLLPDSRDADDVGDGATSSLIREGDTIQSLMPQIRNCHVVFAQPMAIIESSDKDYKKIAPIGFASYHLKYTELGAPPLMHMEHLFVNPTYRSQGAGLALMNELANIGKQHRCSHMEWIVHRGNTRGVQFYKGIGAKDIEQHQIVNPQKDTRGVGNDNASNTLKWIPPQWSLQALTALQVVLFEVDSETRTKSTS